MLDADHFSGGLSQVFTSLGLILLNSKVPVAECYRFMFGSSHISICCPRCTLQAHAKPVHMLATKKFTLASGPPTARRKKGASDSRTFTFSRIVNRCSAESRRIALC